MATSGFLWLIGFVFLTTVHCAPTEEPVVGCKLPEEHSIGGTFIVTDNEFEEDNATVPLVSPGSSLKSFCQLEYKLIGAPVIQCRQNGDWDSDFPKCYKRLCQKLPEVEGGRWIGRLRGVNRVVGLRCEEGYVLQNPEVSKIKCSRVNQTELDWTGVMPFCRKLASCPDPGSPVKDTGHRMPSEGPFYEGDVVEFECSDEYELVGEPTILCGQNSAWDFPRPRCKPKLVCEDLPLDPHGVHIVSPSSRAADYYVPMERVDLICKKGYTPDYSRGPDMIGCMDDGLWDDELTTCVETECEQPLLPKSGYVVQEDIREVYKYNHEIRIRCAPGFRMFGYNWNRCTEHDWLHPFPKCYEVTCREPLPPEYGSRQGASAPFRVNSTVTFSCFDGYTLIGSSSRTCMSNGQWDGNLATCTTLTSDGCPNPGQPMDGIRSGSNFHTGDTVQFKCHPGFSLVGSPNRTCQANGEWDGQEARCRGSRDVDRDQDVKVKLWNELDTKLALLDSERHPNGDEEGAMAGRILDLSIRDAGGHLVFYFVFDSSDSVGHANFQTSMKFARALVNRVGLSNNVHVGVVTFGKFAQRELFPLNNTRQGVMNKLSNVTYIGGGTATSAALEEVMRMVALVGNKLLNVKSVVFLLTDGLDNVGVNPEEKATTLKELGAEIFIIGLQGHKEINTKRIRRMASSDDHIFYVQGFETLEYLIDQMLNDSIDYSRCGISVRNGSEIEQKGRIFGGTDAVIYWPWMAHLAIKFFDPEANKVKDGMCGGSIVDNSWIMTAAHCLSPTLPASNITVTVGLLTLDGSGDKERQKRSVDRILFHPNYEAKQYDYDVALLKLKSPVVYGKVVRRICLPPEFQEITNNSFLYRANEQATVVGFGLTEERTRSNNLKEVQVQIQTTETCQRSIKHKKANMTDRMICAGVKEGGKDACHGDSGGPLMQELHPGSEMEEPYWVQIGVVSWGIKDKCGVRGYYGFYTHVAKVKQWIMNTIFSQ